jgi:hypothetical protein
MTRKAKVEAGSGNIFADLGLPDADNHFLKAQIVSEIYRLAGALKFTQAQTGSASASVSRKCPACSKDISANIPSSG